MEQEDLYEILGIAKDASEPEVRAACRRLLGQVHPDHGGSDALFRVVYRAYAVLTDPARRAAYDEQLRRGSEPTSDEPAPEPPAGGDDELGPWLLPQPGPLRASAARSPQAERHPGAIALMHHPSLSLLLAALVLVVAARIAELHGLAALALGLGGLAALGQIGHRRALESEAARRARIRELDQTSDEDFQSQLVSVLRRDGFAVRVVTKRKDARADLIVKKDGVTTAVVLERGREAVEADAVRGLGGARARYRVDRTLVVSNADFTAPAVAAAEDEEVALIGRRELIALMAAQVDRSPLRGWELLRGELVHGLPAAIGLAASALLGLQSLLDAAIALAANTMVLEDQPAARGDQTLGRDAAAS
ncbi:MAG: restriction endonuclease [Actinomycetota bacterium]|nr:restriction endonuclease [Actinomycetota bacterium]